MRNRLSIQAAVFVAVLGAACIGQVGATQPARPAAVDGEITVYFSPQGGATQAIVTEIAQARSTVQVQAYSFSSAEIAQALLDAHKRGVKVVAVLGQSQQTRSHTAGCYSATRSLTDVCFD